PRPIATSCSPWKKRLVSAPRTNCCCNWRTSRIRALRRNRPSRVLNKTRSALLVEEHFGPKIRQVQRKAPEDRFSRDPLRIFEHLRLAFGPIDMHLLSTRIDHPAELRPVGNVLLHFRENAAARVRR